jgi:hypothetical protein
MRPISLVANNYLTLFLNISFYSLESEGIFKTLAIITKVKNNYKCGYMGNWSLDLWWPGSSAYC